MPDKIDQINKLIKALPLPKKGLYKLKDNINLDDYIAILQSKRENKTYTIDASELGGSSTGIQSLTAGDNITIDDTDPLNPIVSASGGGGGGSPAGSDTQIQYNNAGAFGADSDFTFDDSNKLFKVKDTANTYDLISIGSPATVNEASFGWRGNHDAGSFLMFQGSTPNEFKLYTDGVQKVYINSNQFLVGLDHTVQSAVAFTGSGLNDLVRSGTFSGTYPTTYTVTIDGVNKDFLVIDQSTITGGSFAVSDVVTNGTGGVATVISTTTISTGGPFGSTFVYLEVNITAGAFARPETISNGSGVSGVIDTVDIFDTYTFTDGTTALNDVPVLTSTSVNISGISSTFGATTGHTLSDSWTWTYSYVNQNVLDFSNNDYKFQSVLGTDTFGYQISDNLLGAGITGSVNTWSTTGGDLGISGFADLDDGFGFNSFIQWASGSVSTLFFTEDNGRLEVNYLGSKSKLNLLPNEFDLTGTLSGLENGVSLRSGFVSIGNLGGGNNTKITIDDVNEQITISNLSAYDDDTAAGVGGLTAGMVYMTTGSGSAPLDAAGILMIKQ